MKSSSVRVRFAPSPTGFMHLGNVRAALMNFLFARQKQGTFILRIEDTDAQRDASQYGTQIFEDLAWLGFSYDEGPDKGGPHAPYRQSERTDIYEKHLHILEEKKSVYRCFCTTEELEKKRQRQIALKLPPRYDRTCCALTDAQINERLAAHVPFIWRFKLDETKSSNFYDMAKQNMSFELKNFSDFSLTRQDGSFTFMFANFVDDLTMNITHVFRGEDHLTNTAGQVALYQEFNAQIPVFWHLPIMINHEGKKLSKRDFGFSLTDLKKAGFVHEAISNYLAIISGSFSQEIMSIEQLIAQVNFDAVASTGQVRYDVEKLRWINHHWLMSYQPSVLASLCADMLREAYPAVTDLSHEKLTFLISHIREELVTLRDSVSALKFIFEEPSVSPEILEAYKLSEFKSFFETELMPLSSQISDTSEYVTQVQKKSRERGYKLKDIFTLYRLALTGKTEGPGIKELLTMLGHEEAHKRLKRLIV